MRTAVDSSILLAVFVGSGPYVGPSQRGLQEAIAQGSLIVSEVVWAEVRAHFPSEAKFRQAMELLGLPTWQVLRKPPVRQVVPGLVIEREGGGVNT